MDSGSLGGKVFPVDYVININDWIGPVLAIGAILTGAGILAGEALWHSLFGED